MTGQRGLRLFAAATAAALALSACGGGDEPAEEPTDATGDEATESAANEVEITGVNYAFEGVPETAEAGTRLTFANASENEAHELVLLRIADGEERSLDELLALPEEEAGEVAQFQGVAFAFPGEEAMYPEGETVLAEPGRYALICFIPVGADVEALREAVQAQAEGGESGPPDMGDGPPHFTQGMKAEIVVS